MHHEMHACMHASTNACMQACTNACGRGRDGFVCVCFVLLVLFVVLACKYMSQEETEAYQRLYNDACSSVYSREERLEQVKCLHEYK